MDSKRRSIVESLNGTVNVPMLAGIFLAFLLAHQQGEALSLISEKCDPTKVGPDETTVKGGWQAEIFSGLSFRACGKFSQFISIR